MSIFFSRRTPPSPLRLACCYSILTGPIGLISPIGPINASRLLKGAIGKLIALLVVGHFVVDIVFAVALHDELGGDLELAHHVVILEERLLLDLGPAGHL